MNVHRLIQTHLLRRSRLSLLLYPLGALNASIQALRRRFAFPHPFHAPCKIISIGNLGSGGSGKTPLTIALAKMLQDSGFRVCISHRGYMGAFENKPSIISDIHRVLFPADQTGDEAYQIASSLPHTPVVVGRRRKHAIKLLLKHFPATQVIIMDDTFQHLQVHRDINILSFSAETGLGNGFVLPAGYLREGLSALSACDVAIIHHKGTLPESPAWEQQIASRIARLFHSHSKAVHCMDPQGKLHPLGYLHDKSIALVSGIADPSSFEATASQLGLGFSHHYAFADHYPFNDPQVLAQLRNDPSDLLLCTQKDLMKLSRHAFLASHLLALVLDYRINGAATFLQFIIAKLDQDR